MKILNRIITFTIPILISCSAGKYDDLPLDKRFWTPDDYDKVIRSVKFQNKDEMLPNFNDPESRVILEKLIDHENYKVVLDDDELGLKYRNELASAFFKEWKQLNDLYWQMDRQDKYIYPLELVECYKFGLGLQLRYFPLGNEAMKENSIDPGSSELNRIIKSNVKTLISNYGNYLEIVKNEEAFSEAALNAYGEGIVIYFTELINMYPQSNYNGIKNKLELLSKKLESKSINESIERIIKLIEEKETKTEG